MRRAVNGPMCDVQSRTVFEKDQLVLFRKAQSFTTNLV